MDIAYWVFTKHLDFCAVTFWDVNVAKFILIGTCKKMKYAKAILGVKCMYQNTFTNVISLKEKN